MQSGQGTAVYTIRHGDAAVSISGIRRRTIQLQALITRAPAKMCGGNLIAGDAVVPCFAGEADHIRAGQYRFAALVRLLVFLVGQVRNHRRMTQVLLQRIEPRGQPDFGKRSEFRWVEVLLHVPVAHGHPEESLRSPALHQGFLSGGSLTRCEQAREERQSDGVSLLSKEAAAA